MAVASNSSRPRVTQRWLTNVCASPSISPDREKFRKSGDPHRVPGALADQHSVGTALRRWGGAILSGGGKYDTDSQHLRPEPANELITEFQIPGDDLEPLMDLGAIAVAGTWKGLPQEIVGHVASMLRDDLKSLKACSLTYKALFVSTRHGIHRGVSPTLENNWDSLTIPEKQRSIRGESFDIAIRILSRIAAHGLSPYACHLYIHLNRNFTRLTFNRLTTTSSISIGFQN